MFEHRLRRPFLVGLMSLVASAAVAATPDAGDWLQWRGPQQNGISTEHPLPSTWSPKGENLLWRKPEFATRSTPVVMNGKLYSICRAFPETTQEGEKIVCVNAATGELLWEAINNVFLSDAPAERVGWSSVVADRDSNSVFALGLGCYFQCLDAETGAVRWAHSMSEEYGMLSTYGGRTNFPVVFEDLVIISGVMTGWGEAAVPAHRFVAFDKRTGQAVWFASTRPRPEDTTYCTPILTNFAGQAAMVVGGGDGSLYAFQPRTGQVIWKYDASNRGINTTPLVQDGIVYCGHSEQNAAAPDILGALFALDGRRKGQITEQDLLWKIPGRTVGRSQPILIGDRLYATDDGSALWIVDARTGKDIGDKKKVKKLGRVMQGSLVYGDGKIFAGEASGNWSILQPTDEGVEILSKGRLREEEILGSPIISGGRVYLPTTGALYCIGTADSQVATDPLPVTPEETPVEKDQTIAHLQVVPVESLVAAGDKIPFTVRAFNQNGQYLKDVTAELTVQGAGTIDSTGQFVADTGSKHGTAIVTAKLGELAGTARIRVAPPLPWSFNFTDKQVPSTWIGAAYRHKPMDLEGESVLVKVSTIPKGTRSQSWMGPTELHDYTVQADFLATEREGKRPDMGLINQRYTLSLQATQELQIRSWTSRLELRFAKTIPFPWQAGTWYTVKFRGENVDGKAVLRGKVWPRDQAEPTEWTIEAADATPNTTGSPGLFGNASDAEFYIDNVKVNAN